MSLRAFCLSRASTASLTVAAVSPVSAGSDRFVAFPRNTASVGAGVAVAEAAPDCDRAPNRNGIGTGVAETPGERRERGCSGPLLGRVLPARGRERKETTTLG